jgi:predicted HTH transcriptional regulator
MLTDEQLSEALAVGREQSAIEFKGPGARSDRRLVAQVIRAMLAMSNRRYGGHVIVGVVDDGRRLDPIGVSSDDVLTWTFDTLADVVARFAEPSIAFDLRIARVDNRELVVIEVMEFDEVPTICRRDFNDKNKLLLREGACYVRPRRKPETVEVATYADMRDLIELASEKNVRRFMSTAQRAGLRVSSQQADREAYDQQSQEF